MRKSPTCYIIAGPNGAGKTTFAMKYLPKIAGCLNFINADEIARGLSPLNVEAVQLHDCMLSPSSLTSISKHIIGKLNQSGPLAHMFAMRLSDEHKIKTVSIISFALNILIRPKNPDGLLKIWNSGRKNELLGNTVDNDLLNEYQDFCTEKIRDFLIAMKDNLSDHQWQIAARKSEGILNVTSINGMLNCIRELISNNEISDIATYRKKLEHVSEFKFLEYKSSQYRKMGHDLYEKYWGSNVEEPKV